MDAGKSPETLNIILRGFGLHVGLLSASRGCTPKKSEP